MSLNGSVSRSLFCPTDDVVNKCRTPSCISHEDYENLDKEAKIEGKWFPGLLFLRRGMRNVRGSKCRNYIGYDSSTRSASQDTSEMDDPDTIQRHYAEDLYHRLQRLCYYSQINEYNNEKSHTIIPKSVTGENMDISTFSSIDGDNLMNDSNSNGRYNSNNNTNDVDNGTISYNISLDTMNNNDNYSNVNIMNETGMSTPMPHVSVNNSNDDVAPIPDQYDVEFQRKKASSERQFLLNEMRNQERRIHELLNEQIKTIDVHSSSFMEEELTRRYLLDAAVMQRMGLKMPYSTRDVLAHSNIAPYYLRPQLLGKYHIPSFRENHTVLTATDGSWKAFKIIPNFSKGKSIFIYMNDDLNITQTGEPFDLRCRRSRDCFKLEKWSMIAPHLPKASIMTHENIQLLSDRDGGLLYYNPVLDRYSSFYYFDRSKFVDRGTVVDTIRSSRDYHQQDDSLSIHPVAGKLMKGYQHHCDPNSERDILEYPESNIWAGIVRQEKEEGVANKFNSTNNKMTTGVDNDTTRVWKSNDDEEEPFSKDNDRVVYSEGDHNRSLFNNQENSGALPNIKVVTKSPLSMLIQDQQRNLANSDLPNLSISLTAAMNPESISPPLLFEDEMDNQTYALYRSMVLKLSEEPRDPVEMLKLSNFLHSIKMEHASMMVLQRVMDILREWKLSDESLALLKLLESKIGIGVFGKYECLSDMKHIAITCKDSAPILSQVALYYNRLKYIEQAEQLYIAALLIDPLYAEANRGYAHLLVQKSNFIAANRYFVRVPETALCYSLVKTELGWLQEMQGYDEEGSLQAFKKCLSLGKRDRGTCCALYSIGHYFHIRGDFTKALDFYRRSLMYNQNDGVTLQLLGSIGNMLYEKDFSMFQTDSWYRRALIMQKRGSSRWISLLMYAEFVISRFQDFQRAELYLWESVKESISKEIWPLIAIAQYFQYTQNDILKAKRLLMWCIKSRTKIRLMKTNTDHKTALHNKNFRSSGLGLEGVDDNAGFQSTRLQEDFMTSNASPTSNASNNAGMNKSNNGNITKENDVLKEKSTDEEVVLLVAIAYCLMDIGEYADALSNVNNVISLKPTFGPAFRCLGLILYREEKYKPQALAHFLTSLKLCGIEVNRNFEALRFDKTSSWGNVLNMNTLKTTSVILALEGKYMVALALMEQVCLKNCTDPLAWRALGMMTYLYGEGEREHNILSAINYLSIASELSEGIDAETFVLKGQLLMECNKLRDARDAFNEAMEIMPGHQVLLASLALCLHKLGFKSSWKSCAKDYEVKFGQMKSVGELCDVEDPDELLYAATNVTINLKLQTVNVDRMKQNETGNDLLSNKIDVLPDILYWHGIYELQKDDDQHVTLAKSFFLRAVQRNDCPPHPLALYMLGWLAELNSEMDAAEKYYCYAIQLESISNTQYLQLVGLVRDTLSFVKCLLKSSLARDKTRKKLLIKKAKMRKRGISLPNGSEYDEKGELSSNLDFLRKRLMLHERLLTLAELRREGMSGLRQKINIPGRCIYIQTNWLNQLLHAFSICDDWASLFASSKDRSERSRV
jgi:tetratricopeptide (TPR) repeat protein